jgi:hypothetical protein
MEVLLLFWARISWPGRLSLVVHDRKVARSSLLRRGRDTLRQNPIPL